MRKVLLLRAGFGIFFFYSKSLFLFAILIFLVSTDSQRMVVTEIHRGATQKTVCRCNHLTHFAALVDFRGDAEVFFFFLRYFTFNK